MGFGAKPFCVSGIDVRVTFADQGEPIGKVCGHSAELLRGELVIRTMPDKWQELVAGVKQHAGHHHDRIFAKICDGNPHARDFPDTVKMRYEDVDIGAWEHPLPEVGVYELGICGLAGPAVRGGIANGLKDMRSFDLEEAEILVAAQGFEASTPLMLTLLMSPTFMMMQGRWMSRPVPERCWKDLQSGELYSLYYVYEENRWEGRLQNVYWKLALGKANYQYTGILRLVSFKRKS